MGRSRTVLAVFGAAVALSLLLAACGTGPASTPPVTTPSATTGPRVLQPSHSPDPNFDWGQTVWITGSTVTPRWLVATCCYPITWRNETTATQAVVFDHQLVKSGPIPPGGTFTYDPENVQSIAYHLGSDASVHGIVQVNQPNET